jgi:hypothetical protein
MIWPGGADYEKHYVKKHSDSLKMNVKKSSTPEKNICIFDMKPQKLWLRESDYYEVLMNISFDTRIGL